MERAYNALATSNEQRATSNEQRATSNEQRATSNEQRARNIRFLADNQAALYSHVYLNTKRHSAVRATLLLSDGVLRI